METAFPKAAKHPCFHLLAWYTSFRGQKSSGLREFKMDINETLKTSTKESPMRDILHKTEAILHGRGKVITLREHAEEKECITDVRKNFIYLATEAQSEEKQSIPRVHIQKSFDSVTQDEKFSFRVKGFFYVNHSRRLMKVDYCHTLKINLHWNAHVSSPKKTVTMA